METTTANGSISRRVNVLKVIPVGRHTRYWPIAQALRSAPLCRFGLVVLGGCCLLWQQALTKRIFASADSRWIQCRQWPVGSGAVCRCCCGQCCRGTGRIRGRSLYHGSSGCWPATSAAMGIPTLGVTGTFGWISCRPLLPSFFGQLESVRFPVTAVFKAMLSSKYNRRVSKTTSRTHAPMP
jgi:hypothetical protein